MGKLWRLDLMAFAEKWDKQYPTISKSGLTHWQRIIPFFAFPVEIRKAIDTTNAIESMNMSLRKLLKNHYDRTSAPCTPRSNV